MAHRPYEQCALVWMRLQDRRDGGTFEVTVPAAWQPDPDRFRIVKMRDLAERKVDVFLTESTLYERVAAAVAGGEF
jgi:hypothetical protein